MSWKPKQMSFKNALAPAATLLSWIYVYLMFMLGAWVLLATLATGWSPVVISSGSMQPALKVGDVVLIEENFEGLVAQNSVITFRSIDDADQLITHRVHATDELNNVYITRGDANANIDTDPVQVANVRGVGRLVVPIVGLPLVWVQQGNTAALAAWAVLSLAALAAAWSSARTIRRQRAQDPRRESGSALAQKGVRRVRVLVAAMIMAQFVIDPSRFEIAELSIARWQVLAVAITLLMSVNAVSLWASRSGDEKRISRTMVAELAVDTVGAIVLTTATGTSGIGWVLFALPVIEAAARFNLVGALMHWMGLTAMALATRIWVIDRSDKSVDLINQLEGMLDQLSVLLLVIIPGAQLLEQLTIDSRSQREVTDAAVERGQRLQQVAELGHEINRLGVELFGTIATAVTGLGFDEADVVSFSNGQWTVLAHDGSVAGHSCLAEPGAGASALQRSDLLFPEVVVDGADLDQHEREAIADGTLGTIIRITVSERDEVLVAVRAGNRHGREVEPAAVEALRLLCGQVTVALQNEQLLTELKGMHRQMETQARHDSLTGLPNRWYFLQQLNEELTEHSDRELEVLFIDLDGFKPINDIHGHEVGDALLREVGRRLQDAAGPTGFVGRLGGDEFTVLLRDVASHRSAAEVAGAIQDALGLGFTIDTEVVHIGSSIGSATSSPTIESSELLRRADTAMYAAKATAGNRPFMAYHDGLDEADRRRTLLSEALAEAIKSDSLDVAYQPILATATGKIAGVEALLRWSSPLVGSVPPDVIIETAEAAGLVEGLNRWIVARSLRDASSFGLPSDLQFFLTINASPRELEAPFLLPHLNESLHMSGLRPEQIIVEMSERIVTHEEGYAANLERLSDLGVRIALDDFGEGKTSLAHLRGLPIDMLKLDRTLVQQAAQSRPDRIILESVTSLAHELGFQVVAEGIETAEQLEAVRHAGIDLLQGYLLHRPMPMAQILELIRRQQANEDAPGGLPSAELQTDAQIPNTAAALTADQLAAAAAVTARNKFDDTGVQP